MYLSIIILPLLGSIVSGFFGRKVGISGAQLITSSCVIITTLLSALCFVEVGFNNIPVTMNLFRWIDSEWFNIIWGFQFDSLTVSMLIPVLIISSLVHIYSISYMSNDPHIQRFFSYLSLFTFMMIILVTGNNYLLMFVGWEGVGVCSYLLVSFWFTRIAANQSSISAFLANRVGDCFVVIGMFAILWSLGNLDYATVFSLAPYINSNVVLIIGICLLIGAMAKSSQVGLHVWLPMAMEGPTPVSALIHAATMVTAGVYLLMRSSPLIEYNSTLLLLCLWLGGITTVFSSMIGLFQQDIKKVIAYSTMSQLGMMVIAIGLSSYNVALFHLINHAFYKALLFLGAGSVIHAVADNQDFRKFGGLISYLPLTYSVMLIASLSLVAFPFMTGFYSKDFILESAYGQFSFSGVAIYIIATIGAIFTTLYSVKVLYLTFLANPNGPKVYYLLDSFPRNTKYAHEGDLFLTLPLVILALFSIFFGFITKDIFIGLGSNFFVDNSLFIHPIHEIMIDTEFAVPVLFKLLPFIFTISFSIIALTLSELLSELVIYFKLSRLGYNIFGFFNQRFLIEFFYNKYITNLILNLGGQITKILDKGSIELFGPFGLEKGLVRLSKNISSLSTSHVTTYALYILVGFTIYLVCYFLQLDLWLILIIIIMLWMIGDGYSSADHAIEINYNYSNKQKTPRIYIYNDKKMFSTSAAFLYPGNDGNDRPSLNDLDKEVLEKFVKAEEEVKTALNEYIAANQAHGKAQELNNPAEESRLHEELKDKEKDLQFKAAKYEHTREEVQHKSGLYFERDKSLDSTYAPSWLPGAEYYDPVNDRLKDDSEVSAGVDNSESPAVHEEEKSKSKESPLDYVIENKNCEMPPISESDGGD
uniref:NADH-ubiquinone oxidoreductase chain 5 n=1 Tax=Madurella sp. TaxID=2420206 RepID=A0AAU7YUV0_9PEZI